MKKKVKVPPTFDLLTDCKKKYLVERVNLKIKIDKILVQLNLL